MTASSPVDVQRLPRDLALIALAIQASVTVVGTGAQLIWSPFAEDMRRVYTTPQALLPTLSSAIVNWVFAAMLAWCFSRHVLDRHGRVDLVRPSSSRGIFGVVFLLLVLVQRYVLGPLFHQMALSYIRDTAGATGAAGFVFGLSSMLQWALLALLVWVACWLALRRQSAGDRVQASASVAHSSSSPRAAIAWVVAVLFVSLQMLMSSLFQGWINTQQEPSVGALALGWIVTPLLVLGLAFWGAWMGALGAVQPRPLRAITSSALAFVLLQLICIVMAIAWIVWVLRPGHIDGVVGPVAGLAVLYVVLMVILTRSIVSWLYRRSQAVPTR